MQSSNVETILNCIFSSLEGSGVVADKRSHSFYIISGRNGPRWIVPVNAKLGKQVLAQWRPYGVVSQLGWFVLRQLYSFGVASLIPVFKPVSIGPRAALQFPGSDMELQPVIYIGTPGTQQKAIATLVEAGSCKAVAVLKTALEEGARNSLMREANMLEVLEQLGVDNIPKLIAIDEGNRRTWQTVLAGCLSDRQLTERHIGWLLRLPKSNKVTTFDKQKVILTELAKQAGTGLSAEQLKNLNKGIEKLEGTKEIPLLLVHGDFTPWNIKQQPNGRLAVIDWEDADLEGLPLWDLCHFYFMQAYLFSEESQPNKLLVEQYLSGLRIDQADKLNLVRLYLFGTILREGFNRSSEYQEFLMKQISRVSF